MSMYRIGMFANSNECELGLAKSPVSRWKCENDQRVQRSTAACLTEGLLRRQVRPMLACSGSYPKGRRLPPRNTTSKSSM